MRGCNNYKLTANNVHKKTKNKIKIIINCRNIWHKMNGRNKANGVGHFISKHFSMKKQMKKKGGTDIMGFGHNTHNTQ